MLGCLITCTDGSVERVTGYWAVEIMRRVDDRLAVREPERDDDEPDYDAEKPLTPLENHQRNDEHSKLL